MNHKIILFFLITFSSSVFAVDVSNFDIKGVKLNDKYSNIKFPVNCDSPKSNNIGNNRWKYQVVCGGGSGIQMGRELVFNFTHDEIVWSIYREKVFSVKPNFQKIEKQLFVKYGNPTSTGVLKSSYKNPNNIISKSFCWGACKKEHDNDGHFKGSTVYGSKGKSLVVTYHEKNDTYSIWFGLKDTVLEDADSQWARVEYKIFEEKQKEQESNLDL